MNYYLAGAIEENTLVSAGAMEGNILVPAGAMEKKSHSTSRCYGAKSRSTGRYYGKMNCCPAGAMKVCVALRQVLSNKQSYYQRVPSTNR